MPYYVEACWEPDGQAFVPGNVASIAGNPWIISGTNGPGINCAPDATGAAFGNYYLLSFAADGTILSSTVIDHTGAVDAAQSTVAPWSAVSSSSGASTSTPPALDATGCVEAWSLGFMLPVTLYIFSHFAGQVLKTIKWAGN